MRNWSPLKSKNNEVLNQLEERITYSSSRETINSRLQLANQATTLKSSKWATVEETNIEREDLMCPARETSSR